MFATQNTKSGNEIFREAPLLKAGLSWLQKEAGFMVLSEEKKKALISLHSACRCKQNPCVETPLMKIYGTNGFETETEEGRSCVYEFASRINHACVPNAKHTFTAEGDIVFTATENIKPGQEITTNYIGASGPTKFRRDFLLQQYGFVCRCESCTTKMTLRPEMFLARTAVLGKLTPSSTTPIVPGKHTAEEIEAQDEVEVWHKSIVDNNEHIQRGICTRIVEDFARGIQIYSVVVEGAKKTTREYLVKNNRFNLSEEVIDRYTEGKGEVYQHMIQSKAGKISSILNQFSQSF